MTGAGNVAGAAGAEGGTELHAASAHVTQMPDTDKLCSLNDMETKVMWLLMLEAGVALFLLVFIVWWTMFSGKKPAPPPQNKESGRNDDSAP